MEPHAKTPPSPVLSPEVTATQALELLASVSAVSSFEGDVKKIVNFFEKKVHLRSFCAPPLRPQCKILARRLELLVCA